ncbi:MAG: DUF429 domain-containing protein [Anaerolineae bacterium]|nr:DUF429 domain-containing protein [Anaerolineae bacterium]
MSKPVFIGVDLTAGARPITCVILDAHRRVIARAEGDFDATLGAITAHESAVCAVDAPQGHNAGLMADPGYRARLGIPRGSKSYAGYRVCEYELRRRGIGLYNTPPDPTAAQAWMQTGWRFYAALRDAGFANWPGDSRRQVFEVHPHACYTVMLGRRPLRKTTLEGRLQRQLVLYRAGVDVPDPMLALQELTPHRLLLGDLSMDGRLYDHDALDAAAAAYTAWLAAHRPGEVTAVGDPDEGTIVVPAGELKDQYDKA